MEVFFSLADARHKLAWWRQDYNHHRPHSSLADRTPAEFAEIPAVEQAKNGSTFKPVAGDHHLSYISSIVPVIRHQPNYAGRNLQFRAT
ncbi:MAG: transposase [Acidobacteriales bacterium]|nr:transposase [Terriglobales bacterium]